MAITAKNSFYYGFFDELEKLAEEGPTIGSTLANYGQYVLPGLGMFSAGYGLSRLLTKRYKKATVPILTATGLLTGGGLLNYYLRREEEKRRGEE